MFRLFYIEKTPEGLEIPEEIRYNMHGLLSVHIFAPKSASPGRGLCPCLVYFWAALCTAENKLKISAQKCALKG